MSNPFPFTLDNKRYHTWNYHMRETFGGKVMKIPLDAGFTCPNIDGSKGRGGCIYCSAAGSGDFAGDSSLAITDQFYAMRKRMSSKWPDAQCMAYYQAHTNTYTTVDKLCAVIEPVLALPEVVGVAIATRADCLPEEIMDYLGALSERTWLLVELGLQTIHDRTAEIINRCHTYADFLQGYRKLTGRGIRVCVHLINGLPGETAEMMRETAYQVGQLQPHSVKIHMLHLLKGTKAAALYAQNNLPLLTREAYVSIVCDQLELLPPEIVLQRLTGDGKAEDMIAPLWTQKKTIVLNEIDKLLVRRESWQGKGL